MTVIFYCIVNIPVTKSSRPNHLSRLIKVLTLAENMGTDLESLGINPKYGSSWGEGGRYRVLVQIGTSPLKNLCERLGIEAPSEETFSEEEFFRFAERYIADIKASNA